eukprot:TRINITY_DN3849_c1_g1_i1.p1 TRINITY_DN3849_c1_g1~~TRINITY_DN3849_c1_g1_i1.p1  ORF type:complete len:487 (-),score=117.29 TRINITY_DN3849_c1_g1_i1:24-1430(-)
MAYVASGDVPHFPTAAESMGKFESTVAEMNRRLALDALRSKAFVGHEESMSLRLTKVTKESVSRPGTAACPEHEISQETPSFSIVDADAPDKGVEMRKLADEPSMDSTRGDESSQHDQPQQDPSGFELEKRLSMREEKVAERFQAMKRWSAVLQAATALKQTKREPVVLDVNSVQDAFYAIAAAYDMDGDGTLSDEEVVHVLNRCHLFDEQTTQEKARNFFKSWSVGCNTIVGTDLGAEEIEDGIGWEEFESLLRWLSDMKGMEYDAATARLIRLSKKLCDTKSSQTRRLETLFDAFCKKEDGFMTVHEFTKMCYQLDLQRQGQFTTGDMFSVFASVPDKSEHGINFEGFMHIIRLIAGKLGVDENTMYAEVADGVSKLETDEETIVRIKMKIKHAATDAAEGDWREFFRGCDEDQSGCMDWDEFYDMCKARLHLTERQNHLKLLFEKLDVDDSGELSIDEMIEFMET